MTAKNVGTTLMDNEERFLYPKTFDKKLNTTTSGGAFSKLSCIVLSRIKVREKLIK